MALHTPEPWYRRALRGAFAGSVATGAMSVVQFSGAASAGKHPPPIEITRRVHHVLPTRTPRGRSLYLRGIVLHLAFGAVSGAVYGVGAPRRFRELTGTAYAGFIYVASYRGYLAAFGLHPHDERDDARRQAANVAGHVIYGLGLAEVMRWTDPPEPTETDQPAEAS
jgi:hypothetical protein